MAEIAASSEVERIDDRLLELIERRLEERVTQRVEATLKWRYSLIAGAFAAALVVAGIAWNKIIDSAIDGVVHQTQTQIDDRIKALTRTAEETSKNVDVTFAVAGELAKQGAAVVSAANKTLADLGPTLDAIAELESRQRALDVRTKDLTATVGAQPVPALLDDVRLKLAAIGEQVDRLSQIVAKLPGANALTASDGSTAATVRSDVVAVVQRAGEQARQSETAQRMPTVFLQFAGGPREQAQALGATLRAAGYKVPPEDREGAAAHQREVRYFNAEDAPSADALVTATNAALSQLGYHNLAVQKADVTDFRGAKPRPGVLELWIELPALTPRS